MLEELGYTGDSDDVPNELAWLFDDGEFGFEGVAGGLGGQHRVVLGTQTQTDRGLVCVQIASVIGYRSKGSNVY